MPKHFNRIRTGPDLSPRPLANLINSMLDELERLGNVQTDESIEFKDDPTGLFFGVSQALGLTLVQAPSAGIIARSGTTVTSGTCTKLIFDGTSKLTVGTATLDCFNPWDTNVPSSKYAVAAFILGAWFLIAWDCG
jgi:hypothetical protein